MLSAHSSTKVVPGRQRRIGLAGPCGVGKSTLASLIAAQCNELAVIHEPKATPGIEGSEAPSPASVEHFQRLMSTWRLKQAMLNSGARILLFDRTFEEDRDVFLRLYYRLGCIDAAQLDRLSRLSIEAEASVGAPDGTIVLTAAPEVLRQRLEYAQAKRPQWLVKHIGLQHSLYSEWIAEKRDTVLVLDASTIDSITLCAMAMKFIATVVVGDGSHDEKRRLLKEGIVAE